MGNSKNTYFKGMFERPNTTSFFAWKKGPQKLRFSNKKTVNRYLLYKKGTKNVLFCDFKVRFSE